MCPRSSVKDASLIPNDRANSRQFGKWEWSKGISDIVYSSNTSLNSTSYAPNSPAGSAGGLLRDLAVFAVAVKLSGIRSWLYHRNTFETQ